jgi:hypothetical protein
MPGPDRNREKNNKEQSARAKRAPDSKERASSGKGPRPLSLHEDDISRVLSLSREQRSAAVMELQRKYGNQRVQRMLARLIQPEASEVDDPNQVSSDITSYIATQHESGQPLNADTRGEMESAFGQDFSGVRVHTGQKADHLNQEVQAKAFTTGKDIFFRGGAYSPSSSEEKELLAHELTHVVQQQNAPASSSGPSRVTFPNDASEVDAGKVAEAVVRQGALSRQAVEEEEQLDTARQAVEEEEEMQLARQAEEEEELPMAQQAEKEDESVQMARQAEEEEELQMARQAEEEEELQMAWQPEEVARQAERGLQS